MRELSDKSSPSVTSNSSEEVILKSPRDKAVTISVLHSNIGGREFGIKDSYPVESLTICPVGEF